MSKTKNAKNVLPMRRWTRAEDATLQAGVLNGMTTKQLAEILNRTSHSIHCRKNSLGMSDVRIKVPKGIVRKRKQNVAASVTPAPAPKMKPAKRQPKVSEPAKKSNVFDEITSVVSRLTKEHGIKATVIVFES